MLCRMGLLMLTGLSCGSLIERRKGLPSEKSMLYVDFFGTCQLTETSHMIIAQDYVLNLHIEKVILVARMS